MSARCVGPRRRWRCWRASSRWPARRPGRTSAPGTAPTCVAPPARPRHAPARWTAGARLPRHPLPQRGVEPVVLATRAILALPPPAGRAVSRAARSSKHAVEQVRRQRALRRARSPSSGVGARRGGRLPGMFTVGRNFHVIHMTDDLAALDAWYDDVFSVQRYVIENYSPELHRLASLGRHRRAVHRTDAAGVRGRRLEPRSDRSLLRAVGDQLALDRLVRRRRRRPHRAARRTRSGRRRAARAPRRQARARRRRTRGPSDLHAPEQHGHPARVHGAAPEHPGRASAVPYPRRRGGTRRIRSTSARRRTSRSRRATSSGRATSTST